MHKIKILRTIARLNIGGPAIHAILLTEGLDKNKFQTLLVSGSAGPNEGDMSYYAREKNVRPYYIPELGRELNVVNDLISFWKLSKIIKKERPDIIHTHTAKAGTLGRCAGLWHNIFTFSAARKIILIHTFHGHVLSGYFGKFKTGLFIRIERFLAIFTDNIITVSRAVKKELIDLNICKSEKIKIIPLGLELEKFLKIPYRDTEILHIGIIGRLVPVKNHRLFIDSVAKVIKDNPGIAMKFKIIGDGQLRAELENYARRLNLNPALEFTGWQKELIEVYADLDIVALTSDNEGTPVSLIEAMAAGRTVIATDVGGVKDLLGNTENDCVSGPQEKVEPPNPCPQGPGFRPRSINFTVSQRGIKVIPGDPYSVASALSFAIRNESIRKKFYVTARNFVKEKFTKERLIADMENLYTAAWKK